MPHGIAPFNIVEDEKFILWAEISSIRDAGRVQIGFSAFGDRARIAFITFAGSGFDNIATNIDRWLVGKRVQYRRISI